MRLHSGPTLFSKLPAGAISRPKGLISPHGFRTAWSRGCTFGWVLRDIGARLGDGALDLVGIASGDFAGDAADDFKGGLSNAIAAADCCARAGSRTAIGSRTIQPNNPSFVHREDVLAARFLLSMQLPSSLDDNADLLVIDLIVSRHGNLNVVSDAGEGSEQLPDSPVDFQMEITRCPVAQEGEEAAVV